MHVQARTVPETSPPDLEAFVRVLSQPEPPRVPINIEGVSGANVELGGEIIFAVEHGREADAEAWLIEAGYAPRFTEDIFAEEMTGNQAGQLLEIIGKAAETTRSRDRVIRDVLIGAKTGADGVFFVQVAFREVKVLR
jgi:hypothetical protein